MKSLFVLFPVLTTMSITTYALNVQMEINFRGERRALSIPVETLSEDAVSSTGVAIACDGRECSREDEERVRSQIVDAIRVNANRLYKNGVLQDALTTRSVHDISGRSYELNSGVTAEEGLFLYDMIVQNRMTRTLEIGMAYAISTLYILQGHVDARAGDSVVRSVHVAIDPNQRTQWRGIGLLNAMRAELDEILRVHEEPSYIALPFLLHAGETFQMILIDGMHTFDFTLVDFFYADLLLEVGGILVFDDKQMSAVAGVIDFVVKNRAYELVDTPTLPYFAVLRKTRADDRAWDFHVPFSAA